MNDMNRNNVQNGYEGYPPQGDPSYYQNSSRYDNVRAMLNNGDFAGAENELTSVDPNQRDAEWHYLIGTVSMQKGWLEDAYDHFQTACRMEPENPVYKSASDNAGQQRKGTQNGYDSSKKTSDGCCDWYGPCELCECLMLSDCLCDICDGCGN